VVCAAEAAAGAEPGGGPVRLLEVVDLLQHGGQERHHHELGDPVAPDDLEGLGEAVRADVKAKLGVELCMRP